MTDDELIGAAAGPQVGARGVEAGHGIGAASFGLRHVGARHLADGETVLRRLQLARQHVDVVLVEADELLVAHHVHVGGHGLQQHAALHIAQHLALGADVGFRLVHRVVGTKPAEDRLHGVDAIAARLGHPVENRGRTLVVALDADVGIAGDGRPVAGHGARHVFVAGALKGALRIKARIVAVGCRKRILEALGRHGRSSANAEDNDAERQQASGPPCD